MQISCWYFFIHDIELNISKGLCQSIGLKIKVNSNNNIKNFNVVLNKIFEFKIVFFEISKYTKKKTKYWNKTKKPTTLVEIKSEVDKKAHWETPCDVKCYRCG